jgi:hypothetical protein
MQIIGKCPVCNGALNVSKLHCDNCNIEISGDFNLTKFDLLSKSEIRFIELFLVNQGNIKEMEKELNISYPTVKKQLDAIILKLGLQVKQPSLSKEEVISRVASGELSPEEAELLL